MSGPDLLTTVRASAARTGRGVRFLGYGAPDVALSYEEFLHMSAWLSQKIPGNALGRPPTAVIVAGHPLPTLLAFFAALWAGARPVVAPTLTAIGGLRPLLDRVTRMTEGFRDQCVLAVDEELLAAGVDLPDVPVLPLPADVAAYDRLTQAPRPALPEPGGDDIAFFQTTSASTGDAKLVAISHANANANLTALRRALHAGHDERVVTWLPLHHDMGLVGTVLLSFFCGWPLTMMQPTEFIMRPHRWLDALSRHRSTITAAPTFGYDYAARRVSYRELAGWDLSALTRAVIGAEPIRLATLRRFHERFRRYGLRPESLICSYGMAESTLATTMAVPGTAPRYLLVDPARTSPGEPVRIVGEGRLGSPAQPRGGVPVFSCGPALDGLDLRLVVDGSEVTGEGVLGEIALRGPSVCLGYVAPGADAPTPFPDGVHLTGDLGFRHRGELFIVERTKHVIIRNGQNHLASLLEEQVATVLEHPAHEIIVVDRDIHDPTSDIVALVENHRGRTDPTPQQLTALRGLDLPLDLLLLARRRVIPRTTSGKKKYHRTRRALAEQTLPISARIRLTGAGQGER